MGFLSIFTKVSGFKAIIVMAILAAIAVFAKGFKPVKIIAWALVAVTGVCAAINEFKGN